MLKKNAFSFVLICIYSITNAQNPLYSYDFNEGMASWTSVSIQNNGNWTWSAEGKADDGLYWGNRESINGTENGALVYDGDHIINSNQGAQATVYQTAVLSPELNFKQQDQVFLKFNQYFRNYYSSTLLEISIDQGVNWSAIELNTGVNRNVETSNSNLEIIDISDLVANESDVLVRFVIEGDYYFWILDNIEFYDTRPVIPTIPQYVGEFLTLHGYPYEVDNKGWPYIPNEAVVDFTQGTSEIEKVAVREAVGAIVKESCVCNVLETWTLVDDLLEGGIGLSSTGPTTGLDQHVQTSTTSSEVDDIDFNKYNYTELIDGQYTPADINEVLQSLKRAENKDIIKIAILDTGIDLLHRDIANNLYLTNDEPYDDEDNNENCNVDDVIGWNFIDDNNNPSDDHGHGSHVAGIIAKYANESNKRELISLIPYKTHDSKGLANLFDVSCAMYQSIQDEVSVVNCSWGFYGNESDLLETAIKKADDHEIIVIAASGNDATYLQNAQQFPACYQLQNLVSVGSYYIDPKSDQVIVNATFSNFGKEFVDILAPGVDIISTVPYSNYQTKSGTSMAAPVIAGVAASFYNIGYSSPEDIKYMILEEALKLEHLEFEVLDGNVFKQGLEGGSTSLEVLFDYDSLDYMRNDNNNPGQSIIVGIIETGNLSIDFNGHDPLIDINVFNSSGQVVSQLRLNEIQEGTIQTIDLSSLPAGLYFVRVNNEIKKFTIF